MKLLIVGCGYLGRRVALRAQNAGLTVTAVTRTGTPDRQLSAAAIPQLAADLDQQLPPLELAASVVLYLAPPPDTGTSDPRLAAFCNAIGEEERPLRFVYLGTTGVYGDCAGALIDEEAPLRPATDRARRRQAAEETLRAWCGTAGVPLVILRAAGIYGPGRLPLAALSAGQPVIRRDESPCSNRIHVDDLATICLAAVQRGRAGAVYNASDGDSCSMTDYFLAVAAAFRLPSPPQITMAEAAQQLSPALLSYLGESRRIDNRRVLSELGVTLRYPDLARGLAACRAEQG
ncbi:SDR family oxidoreductase [Desulfuromonas carbonis]|uniref:SDR family oxidoreductase n=1 Tax=Desulfuromonas sp. DDH964 TaxID=1823759 RepID=UPI00078BF44B|nr:SDR family oxidoreductase [Desulfuromonas sp. DDH964]AMV71020.1 NAD-dependent nucleoside diphosphate-sugar epimerase/dehydratase [Desulfuromonas sp. DDH964]